MGITTPIYVPIYTSMSYRINVREGKRARRGVAGTVCLWGQVVTHPSVRTLGQVVYHIERYQYAKLQHGSL